MNNISDILIYNIFSIYQQLRIEGIYLYLPKIQVKACTYEK